MPIASNIYTGVVTCSELYFINENKRRPTSFPLCRYITLHHFPNQSTFRSNCLKSNYLSLKFIEKIPTSIALYKYIHYQSIFFGVSNDTSFVL